MTPERDGPAAGYGPDGAQDAAPASVIRAVRAHPMMIALIALAAVLAAGLWLASRSPTYEARAEILVTPVPDDGGPDRSLPLLRTSGDRTRIVQTASTLVDSTAAATLAARALGRGWTPEQVANAVDVEPIGQTDVLAVTAQDGDPRMAALLANGFARAALDARARALKPQFTARIEHLDGELQAIPDKASPLAVDLAEQLSELRALSATGDPTLSLSRSAQLPTGAIGTSSALIMVLALLVGLVVGIGTALVAELWGPARVADAAEASTTADSPVLARVPARTATGQRPPAETAAAAYRTLQLQLAARRPPAQAVLLAGSSSSDEAAGCVTDFGLTLAGLGHDVLLLDLDADGDRLSARLGATLTTSGASTAIEGVRGLRVRAVDHRGGAADDPTALIAQARERFHYVLVNAPPLAESGEALRVVRAVDAVLLVVRPRRTTREAFETALGLLERTRGVPDGLLEIAARRTRPGRTTTQAVEQDVPARAAQRGRDPQVPRGLGRVGEQPDRSGG